MATGLTTTQRGYGWKHRKERAANIPAAYGTPCVRCGRPMMWGQALHYDHNDNRDGYLGFSHDDCNRKAGARLGARRRWGKPRRAITADRW